MTPDMDFAAKSLSVCIDELRRLVGFYELFVALQAVDAGRRGTINPVLNSISNINVSLIRNIVIILPALFDNDPRSVNLLRIIKIVLDNRSKPSLYAFHRLFPGGKTELDRLIRKLRVVQMLLRSQKFKSNLERIANSRNKLISHYDVESGIIHAEHNLREIEYVFLLSAKAAVICTSIMTIRSYSISWTKKASAEQAKAFIDVIKPAVGD